MASVRRRDWNSGGETREAWIADYFDQNGKRHIKTLDKKKEADAFLVGARHDVSQATQTAESASVTVAKAAELWIESGELETHERSPLKGSPGQVHHHINPRSADVKLAKLTTLAV